MSSNSIHTYLRNKHNQKIGVILGLAHNGLYSIGVSVANVNAGDRFNAKQGIDMAKGRALRTIKDWQANDVAARLAAKAIGHEIIAEPVTVECPARVVDDVLAFQKRAARYFKDQKPAVGRIEASVIKMNFEKSVAELTSLFDGHNSKQLKTNLVSEAKQLVKVGQALNVISDDDTTRFTGAGTMVKAQEVKT